MGMVADDAIQIDSRRRRVEHTDGMETYLDRIAHDDIEHAGSLLAKKRKYLVACGYRIIDWTLHTDHLATPRVWGWVLYRSIHHGEREA